MGDHTALAKHSCAACGAQAEWDPSKQALVCGFCGTVAPASLDLASGTIEEIDLVRALREIPDELRGWRVERRTVKCRSCHAISVFEGARVGQNCDFCGSPELVDYDEIRAPIRPQSVLPFKLDQVRAREHLRRWFGSRWFAPSSLRKRAWVDTVRGLYIPYWTFDSRVRCRWTAQSGTYYYTTRTTTDSKGRQRRRRVRHVRWRPAAGEIEHFFDDQPVPGTRGIDATLLRQVEPFPTDDLVPYDTAYLSGFVVEHYQVVLIDAAQQARESMNQELKRLCAAEVPGDTHTDLQIDPRHAEQTFKHILVPIWLLAYDYGPRKFRTVINGHTGAVAGSYPRSPWKITLAVLAGLLAAALILLLAR